MQIFYSRALVCQLAEEILIAAKRGTDIKGLKIDVPLSITDAENTARNAIKSALASDNVAVFQE